MENETSTTMKTAETAETAGAAALPQEEGTDTKPAEPGGAGMEASAESKGGAVYDQAYIDRMLAYQAQLRDEAVAEALKVAGMDAESKEAYEKQKEEKRLADREAGIALRELKADARGLMEEKDIPAAFLDILVGKDLEETRKNADAFKKQFDSAVQAQVEKRISGRTPSGETGGGASGGTAAMESEIDKYMN